MRYPTTCPLCGSSLIAGPIPETMRHLYEGARFFTHALAQVVDGKVVAWKCPSCFGLFERHEVDSAHESEQESAHDGEQERTC